MMREISKEEFIATAPEILNSVGTDLVIIQQGKQVIGALVGPQEFEQLRRARGERAIAAMNRLSDALEASGATEEKLKELEAALDRKA